MTDKDLMATLSRYKFYHCIKLTDSISTPGHESFIPIQKSILKALNTMNIQGRRVLDIGCRDGLFSFECEKRGSSEIIGIDNNLSKVAIEFLIPYFNSKVKMFEMNLYELKPARFGIFDVVIFAGVLYHLRYPFWGLKVIRDILKVGGNLLLETAIYEDDSNHAMLYCPVGSESPYEPTSCSFFNEKGLKDTLSSLGFEVQVLEYVDKIIQEVDASSLHKKSIKRGVFLATFVDLQNKIVKNYWDGTHSIHLEIGGNNKEDDIQGYIKKLY